MKKLLVMLYKVLRTRKQKNKKESIQVEKNEDIQTLELSKDEKEKIIKSLPKFKYRPNLYENNDVVIFKKGVCQCCEKEVKAYVGYMFCDESINCICLDCVADGSAAKKFDGFFIAIEEETKDKMATSELMYKTPGYIAWQQEQWLICCDDYCEFIGYVGVKELNEMGIAAEVFDEYEKNEKNYNNVNDEYIDWIKNNLTARGEVAGYLFHCKKCGKHHLHVDMS